MILDKVYDADNRLTSLSRYHGEWIFLLGRCPQCKKRVAKESAKMQHPKTSPEFLVKEITCCRKFFPTKMALVEDGQILDTDELGSTYQDDPGDLTNNMDAWSLYILWDAGRKLDKSKMPTPPDAGSLQASEWLARMIFLVSSPGLFSDFALSSAEKIARQVEKKKLYQEFWGLVPVIYRYAARLAPQQTSAMFAVYRSTFRYLSGNAALIAALDKDGPVLMEVFDPSHGMIRLQDNAIWPWDTYAFTFPLVDSLDNEFWETKTGIFVINDEPDESSFSRQLDRVRSGRRYTLTPGGVRVVLPGPEEGISEILLKEQGSLVTAKIVVKDINLSHLCWFDWSTGIGFSPWQVVNEYSPAKDPLLGTVAGVFAELVTGHEREIKKRTFSGESAILLPGDGQVKMRTVYMGRGQDRTRVRVKIAVERKAPGPHAVAGHLRRVRNAASAEAAERAREYGIAVPEGYTFVRPFRKGSQEN